LSPDKTIKFNHPDLPLPPDLSKSCKELDDYLSGLKGESDMSQRRHMRYAKMSRTRQQNVLKQVNVVEVPIDKRSVVICNNTLDKRSVVICNNTLEDSSIIVEKRVGYRVSCPRCSWTWVWHGRKDRFFISCSRCHKSFKLNWK
jgi:hypothetical protein